MRLENGGAGLELLAGHFDSIADLLGPQAAAKLEQEFDAAKTLRSAADVASKEGFAGEPLAGIGSETWRALWEAAEAYSQTEAYHDHEFPVTDDGARCPLCQQELGVDAKERLARFQTFVHDETAKRAKEAERIYGDATYELKQFEVVTVAATNALAFLETEDPKLAESLKGGINRAGQAKNRIIERLRGETEQAAVELLDVDTGALRIAAAGVRGRASNIDAAEFAAQLRTASIDKNELVDRFELAKHADKLKADVKRQRKVKAITALRGSLSTQPITKQSVALTREHVTRVIDDRFSRESEHLGLEHVMLGDQGGGKGKLRHKPALLGATLKNADLRDVLSEGEQTALGLAGLLTELQFDASGSALVLDDPITSLDHGRREKVARRIAKLAAKRQVIVFTHDLTFLGDLVRGAEEEEILLQERSIVKDNQHVPGRVLETHPWKAKDAKKRIGDLRADLAKLKKEQVGLTPEDYENRVKLWAGHLSETWERVVRNDIVGKVVERGTTEVRPKMLRLLARITEQDNNDFQAGYGQVSKWAPRHDKSEEVNFVAPTIAEMEAELDRIDAWHKRVAGYAQA